MAHYERQHWAPQSYLRRFSPDDAHVWMLDKPTGTVAFPNIRDVARDKFFNDGFLRDERGVLPPDVPEGLIEGEFGRWESALAQMTRVALRVASGGGADLDDRQTMSICVALQLTRTPAFRKRLADSVIAVLEDEANAYLAKRMPEAVARFRAKLKVSPSWESALHSDFVWQSGQVVEIAADLYHYIWCVGVNRSSLPLCTSDTPVVGYVHDALSPSAAARTPEREHDVVRRILVGDRPIRGIEVVYPLTPEVALLMYHPSYFAHMQRLQGRAMPMSEREVLHYNALELLHCKRQLYSRTNIFEYVREHAAAYKEVVV